MFFSAERRKSKIPKNEDCYVPCCLRASFLLLLGPPFLQILQFSPDKIPQEVVTPLAIFYEKNFCFKSGQDKKASEQESSHFGKQFQYPSGYLMVPVSVRRLHRYTIQLKKNSGHPGHHFTLSCHFNRRFKFVPFVFPLQTT